MSPTSSPLLSGGFFGIGKKDIEKVKETQEELVTKNKELKTAKDEKKAIDKKIGKLTLEYNDLEEQLKDANKHKISRFFSNGGKKTKRRRASKSKTAKKHRK